LASTTFTDGVTLTDDEWFNHVNDLAYFVQSGTGATERRAELKLNEYLSVTDFGAVGDGSTDDSTAFSNAITKAVATGKALFVPATSGGYKVNTALTATGKFTMFGEVGTNIFTTANITILHLSVVAASFSVLRDLKFTGPGTGTSTAPGLKFTNTNNLKLQNVYVTAFDKGILFAQGAIAPQSCYSCALYDCQIISNGTVNIEGEAATNLLYLSNCTFGGGPCATGLKLVGSVSLRVKGGDCEGMTLCCIDLDSSSENLAGHQIDGLHMEGNSCTAGDVRIGNTAAVRGVTLRDCLYSPTLSEYGINAIRGSGLVIDGGVLRAGYQTEFLSLGASFSDDYSVKGLQTSGLALSDNHRINFRTPDAENPSPLVSHAATTYDSAYADAARFNQYRIKAGSTTAAKTYYANLNTINLESTGSIGAGAKLYAVGGLVLNNEGGDPMRGGYFQGVHIDTLPLSLGQSATAPVITNGSTITTAGVSSVARVAPGGAVTGIILGAGTWDGQICHVINESAAASTVTFAAAGTSNVADGTSAVVTGLRSMTFVWNSSTSRWYRTG
jgi:hypothetical protein